ncbi:extracellular calcium-sensing receptor-like [Rana temporaria]|uniref:extracellular calcium-sensing receptor-like n=1 Tax=Rana temporaria TaxID=8407 RepID=UPI001AAC6256|nr:extracellular calcium-sensing receptor-like [Rana temporaria]
MIFAIEEINKNPDLLPNITLGYQILYACSTIRRVTGGTLWMLSGEKESSPNYRCGRKGNLVGIVGDSGSTGSITMSQILGLYRYPQISYFASSPALSNRNFFPSFFRTIPSDAFQSRGLAKLILYFGWSWVGFLASDTDYGQIGLQVAKQELIKAGVCEAFTETIVIGQPNKNAPHIVKVIKNSTAKVVVVVASNVDFIPVVEELTKQNVTGRIWIASESWSTSALLSKEKYRQVLVSTVGFAVHGGQMPGFKEYLYSLHPSKSPKDSSMLHFWEQIFSCRWTNQLNFDGTSNKTAHDCTGEENLGKSTLKVDFGITFNVYTAVYAFAWALHSLLHCQPGKGPFHNGCADILSFGPWQLLHYIKTTKFQTKDKTSIFFDENGDPPALYDIVNWQPSSTGSLEQVVVGSYDSSSADGKIMSIDSAALVWAENSTKVPPSKCSSSCPPGLMKVTIPGKPICCFQCVSCPQREISNKTDAVRCHPCPWDMCSNTQQDACVPRAVEFLSYNEAIGIILAIIAIFSSVFPLGILGVFIYYKATPIVRANNWSLSCLLLISLCLCFLCSLMFIGYPQPEKCLLRQVMFGLVFSLCISCVLAKTLTVVIAFKATKPGTQLRKFKGIRMSYSLIILCLLIQVSICVTWLSSSPPFPEFDAHTKEIVIVLSCNEGSAVAFWFMLGYLGLLATISFIIAFLVRRLPDSFNEAKFITFSMLAFLSVWISYIPASLSSQGKYVVATEIFAILSSSWALLVCIFLPKCFIILFRPDINSKEHLMKKNHGQNLKIKTII